MSNLKGTKTEQNLMHAFAGESTNILIMQLKLRKKDMNKSQTSS